jgi:hypothetical protein
MTAEETRSLDEIYQGAVAEGGKLTVYAGGDTPTQWDRLAGAFSQRFPRVDLEMIVDYSGVQCFGEGLIGGPGPGGAQERGGGRSCRS